jgi:carboxyl-terminal processing protease
MPGDWIVKVDGKDTANWTLPEAVSKIRGPKGSKVVLTIVKKEASSSAEVTVIRDSIKVASVEWEMLNVDCSHLLSECRIIKEECPECYKLVYLKLIRFGDQTPEEWNKAVDEIILKTKEEEKKNKMKGLVFDLRNNPGGYLSGSVFIASEFLKDGVVVTQENASGIKQTYSVNRKGKFTEMPLVVLINKGTASSSEIVAGALQVRRGIKTVGETSFGKGSIQEAQDLEKGAGLHITTAKWLLPNGKWINGSGIEPDLKVENDPNKPDEDLQLIKGIEVLVK